MDKVPGKEGAVPQEKRDICEEWAKETCSGPEGEQQVVEWEMVLQLYKMWCTDNRSTDGLPHVYSFGAQITEVQTACRICTAVVHR